jgi:serine/threonine protein kinase
VFFGTLQYLPPEYIKKYEYTEASDWWAFGCFLYEMIYGISPFYSSSADRIISKILSNISFFEFIFNFRY